MKPIYVVSLIIIFSMSAFFGGIKYQQKIGQKFQNEFAVGENRMGFRSQRGAGASPINSAGQEPEPTGGEIIKSDEKSLTIKLRDDSTRIVILTDSTKINLTTEVKKEDMKNGERVFVVGSKNPDGSITAQNIQVNPAF